VNEGIARTVVNVVRSQELERKAVRHAKIEAARTSRRAQDSMKFGTGNSAAH
jgi:hypothetical protein